MAAKPGPVMKTLFKMGLPTIQDNPTFWMNLHNEIKAFQEEAEVEEEVTSDDAEFKLTQEGIAEAKKVLDDQYASARRRDAATNFLILAHEKGMFK